MDLVEYTFRRVTDDQAIQALLAETSWGEPAVYDTWITDDRPRPCITIRWEFYRGQIWAMRNGTLNFDIWDEGDDARISDQIRDRLIALFERHHAEGGLSDVSAVRFYNGVNMLVPDEPGIIHTNVSFDVRLWNTRIVQLVLGEEQA